MKISQIKELIRETIQTIFEADLQYNEGDRVEIDSSYGGGIGTIVLSKHPFYAIKFDKTGTTDSFHFSDLRPFDDTEEEEKNADIDTGLNENVLLHENIKTSSNLRYHLNKQLPLYENIFRYGSDAQLELFKEARDLYNKGLLYLNPHDRWLVENTSIGEYGEFESKLVSLDVPFVEEEILNEAEYQGKDVQLNKPKRGGSKKFYVYVKNPKTGKIKKVQFGAAGGGQNLAVKIRDPKARRAFAARQNCARKKDRTTPGYWSCNLPRYAKSLGLKGSFSGYW
jgi:hypothetical protein